MTDLSLDLLASAKCPETTYTQTGILCSELDELACHLLDSFLKILKYFAHKIHWRGYTQTILHVLQVRITGLEGCQEVYNHTTIQWSSLKTCHQITFGLFKLNIHKVLFVQPGCLLIAQGYSLKF